MSKYTIEIHFSKEEYDDLLLLQKITGSSSLPIVIRDAIKHYADMAVIELMGDKPVEEIDDVCKVVAQRVQQLKAAVQLMERRIRRKVKGANE